VIENAVQAEGGDAVAGAAIDERFRMAHRRAGGNDAVAGIASIADNVRAGVVGEGVQEGCRRMAGPALGSGIRMGWCRRLPFGHQAVVTAVA